MFFLRHFILLSYCLPALLTLQAQHFLLRNYTVQEGLIANPVRRIFQDSKGFIWIATWEGLSKYDGYKFTNYSTSNGLSHNLINDLYEADGNLYIAENNGSVDVIKDEVIKRAYTVPQAVNGFLPVGKTRFLLSTDNNGIHTFESGKFLKPLQTAEKLTLNHLIRFDDFHFIGYKTEGTLYLINQDYKLLSSLVFQDLFFNKLYKDYENRVWACTSNGLKLLSPNSKHLSLMPLPCTFNVPEITNSYTTDILEDENGGFWIGSLKGLLHLTATGRIKVYTEKEGLPSQVINTIYQDKEGNIWVGTSLGLAKLVTKNNIQFFKDGTNDVTDIRLSNNRIWLATFEGLKEYKSSLKQFSPLYSLPQLSRSAFVNGNTHTLFYYRNTIEQIDTETGKIVKKRRLKNFSSSDFQSCTDRFGNSFIANNKGIAILLNNGNWYIDTTLPYRVTALLSDNRNYLWVGTWNNGLYRLKYTFINNSLSFLVKDMSSLIKQKNIRSLFKDSKGNIWVGTRYDGAFSVNPALNNTFKITQYEKQQGLISNFVTAFAETKDGDIWIGSFSGLDKLVKNKDSFTVFNFSKITNFFAHIRSIASLDGDRWYCIANTGLAHFSDDKLEHHPPFTTHLLSANFGAGENIAKSQGKDATVRVKHSQNSARFAFSALSFINERQILYSYRLLGSNDTTWSLPQTIHEVSYASLSPARYTFQARTIGWNGAFGKPATISFIVQPPFYQTIWFYIICSILLSFLLYSMYRYRISQVLKWQKARDRIATDLHDDIGSTLTNISILSELSHKNLHKPEKAEHFLKRIIEEVYNTSEAMDDIIWSVNSRNDTLEETLARMRRYAAELFESGSINCYLNLDENNKHVPLTMDLRRDVYLIFKESLNNVYKHASATNAWVDVYRSNECIHLRIKDDGVGFQTEKQSTGNGLFNLQSRVKKWNGRISITAEPGKGTNVDVSIPI
jgi:signal transduction histidine kinase/ligand-binding sensor domain-containing protein